MLSSTTYQPGAQSHGVVTSISKRRAGPVQHISSPTRLASAGQLHSGIIILAVLSISPTFLHAGLVCHGTPKGLASSIRSSRARYMIGRNLSSQEFGLHAMLGLASLHHGDRDPNHGSAAGYTYIDCAGLKSRTLSLNLKQASPDKTHDIVYTMSKMSLKTIAMILYA
jgi:hypothetical protein